LILPRRQLSFKLDARKFIEGDFVIEVSSGDTPPSDPIPVITLIDCSTIDLPDPLVYYEINGKQDCGEVIKGDHVLSVKLDECPGPGPDNSPVPSQKADWSIASVDDILAEVNLRLGQLGLDDINAGLAPTIAGRVTAIRPNGFLKEFQFLFDRNVTAVAKDVSESLTHLIFTFARIPYTRLGTRVSIHPPTLKRELTWESGWGVGVIIKDLTASLTPPPQRPTKDLALYVVLGIFGVCVVIIVAVVVVMLRRKSDGAKYEPIPSVDEEGLVEGDDVF